MRKRATIRARTPEEFERWRRLAEEPRQKNALVTTPVPSEATSTPIGVKNER